MRIPATLIVLGLATAALAQQPNVAKAEMFFTHGLVDDAKREAIHALFATDNEAAKAPARMLLARISAAENRLTDAAALWTSVVQAAPDSDDGRLAKKLLEQCGSSLAWVGNDPVPNALAARYLDTARFWLGRLDATFPIDTTWIDTEASAVHWLDRVIAEFPGTAAAEVAHEYRVRAFLGVPADASGQGGSGALGAVTRPSHPHAEQRRRFLDFMKQAESALVAMQTAFPRSNRLQRLRFLIVDAYWRIDDRQSAAPWLQAMLSAAGDVETFWSQLAQLRLKNWRS